MFKKQNKKNHLPLLPQSPTLKIRKKYNKFKLNKSYEIKRDNIFKNVKNKKFKNYNNRFKIFLETQKSMNNKIFKRIDIFKKNKKINIFKTSIQNKKEKSLVLELKKINNKLIEKKKKIKSKWH